MVVFGLLVTFLPTGQTGVNAQSEQLARNYFKQGDYEKAIITYKKALKKNPKSLTLLKGLVKSYREVESYDEAETLLKEGLENVRNKSLILVDLGYNYQLQEKDSLAQTSYQEAITLLSTHRIGVTQVGKAFQEYNLLEEAVQVYEASLANNPNNSFDIELAKIYGELGEVEKMFSSYLNLVDRRPAYKAVAQRKFGEYITEDPFNEANGIFRKLLLKRLQKEQNVLYNSFLSWLFIQQKEYRKAFAQEKAIFKRTDDMEGLIDLANVIIEDKEFDLAKDVLTHIKVGTYDNAVKIAAEQSLLNLEIKKAATTEEKQAIKTRYEALLAEQSAGGEIVPLQIDYAHFTAFNMGLTQEAVTCLLYTSPSPRDATLSRMPSSA